MISPAKLDKLPTEVVELIGELQDDIIRDVCRRLTKADYLTPTAEWQLYKANQMRLSYDEVNRRIARQLKVREKKVRELYTDTVKQALKEDADIYRIAAAQGKLSNNTGTKIDKYFRSAAFSQLLSKGLKNSRNGIRNLCNSMAAQVNRQLSDAMDLAHLKVISGAYSYNEAIYAAVKELTEKGITRVEYPKGRKDNIDVCVRRAVLSSVNKSCCDIQLDLAKEVGSRYVEVSSHIGARPSHAEWQGQIYCLERGDPKYPYFYDATGYGTGEGLGGWNCRHNFFPYFEGIDTPYHSPDFSKTENNEYYALTQKQRGYERAVRESKRQLAALDGARQSADSPELKAKLDRDFARRSVTLKNREARLEKFIKDNNLQRDNARVRVVGFGKSVSQKAVSSAIKYSSNAMASDKNNVKEFISIVKGKLTAKDFSSLPKDFQCRITSALKNSDKDVAELIIKTLKTAPITISNNDSGYYKIIDFIDINVNAEPRDFVHELFHRSDYFNHITGKNSLLEKALKLDYENLKKASNGDIISYMVEKYPSAFGITEKGKYRLKTEYNGISDIISGLTENKVNIGLHHTQEYWLGNASRLSSEAWANYGYIFFDNNPNVIAMFEELFPSFNYNARHILRRLLK